MKLIRNLIAIGFLLICQSEFIVSAVPRPKSATKVPVGMMPKEDVTESSTKQLKNVDTFYNEAKAYLSISPDKLKMSVIDDIESSSKRIKMGLSRLYNTITNKPLPSGSNNIPSSGIGSVMSRINEYTNISVDELANLDSTIFCNTLNSWMDEVIEVIQAAGTMNKDERDSIYQHYLDVTIPIHKRVQFEGQDNQCMINLLKKLRAALNFDSENKTDAVVDLINHIHMLTQLGLTKEMSDNEFSGKIKPWYLDCVNKIKNMNLNSNQSDMIKKELKETLDSNGLMQLNIFDNKSQMILEVVTDIDKLLDV